MRASVTDILPLAWRDSSRLPFEAGRMDRQCLSTLHQIPVVALDCIQGEHVRSEMSGPRKVKLL